MENQYYQPAGYQQPIDPNYDETVKGFLTKAIVACAICSLPIGSIIAIVMGKTNRQAVLDYINRGGLHTPRVKVCSALSRTAFYCGVGFTILWAFYAVYFTFMIMLAIGVIAANTGFLIG
ncbi:MAG: hypothetical protein IKE94_08635 [Aeriscardovia sp.]|nr:hypothetical protein [Aeriscardovia sp.]MBR3462446.1 hypothetical protein [Clostridiales bacterium]MCR4766950.1 hypothetical protein [Saccharofermentans sp.]